MSECFSVDMILGAFIVYLILDIESAVIVFVVWNIAALLFPKPKIHFRSKQNRDYDY